MLAAVQAGPWATGQEPRCPATDARLERDPDVRILASNRSAIVFTLRGSGALTACRRGGEEIVLASQAEGVVWQPLPALDLTGSLVGWAESTTQGMAIKTEDPGRFAGRRSRGIFFDASQFRVGSLEVHRTAGVAWIQCPASMRKPGPVRSPSPNCVRPGRSVNRVYKAEAGSRTPVLLDRGRSIDPRSLTLRGSTLTWRKGGRLRRARLG